TDPWRPLLDLCSSELCTAGDFQDRCTPECLLWYSPEKHSHFAVTLGGEFLGRLDRFRDGDDGHYDFYPDVASERKRTVEWFQEMSMVDIIASSEVKGYLREQKAQLKESLEQVQADHVAKFEGVVSTALLPMVFGDCIGLTTGQRGILRAILREITRAGGRARHDRPDRAHVFVDGRVQGTRSGVWFKCPLLASLPRAIGFNGNGRKHWGRGYRARTWVSRAGYALPDGEQDFRNTLRSFLSDLAGMVGLLGIVPVGMFRREVFGLEQLQEMARSGQEHELRKLRDLCLRFYAGADYLTDWRQMFAEALAGPDRAAGPPPDEQVLDLRVAMRRLGITQTDLAAHLKRNRTFVNKLLRGKSWPKGLLEEATCFVRSREQLRPGC
ncbi:MAG TPA: helix-turn-helix transcriptional regulator, partial [Gemmataceae bacterium]|nr:helix-turn-helix transcriptional regulator [Gemmataceae bacterium]